MKAVKIGDCVIGEGKPKVIVPIVAKEEKIVLEDIKKAKDSHCDIIEWRIDHYKDVLKENAVSQLSKKIKEITTIPLLITFRSYREGGVLALSDEDYLKLYEEIIENGDFDLIDIELFMPEEADKLIKLAQEKGIKVIICNHDFDKTPEKEEILNRLESMEQRGADICKIALMPNSSDDVLTLLEATNERRKKTNTPLITMSMGQLGMISRLSGEIFGSAATFGTVGHASAPGQAPVSSLTKVLDLLTLT